MKRRAPTANVLRIVTRLEVVEPSVFDDLREEANSALVLAGDPWTPKTTKDALSSYAARCNELIRSIEAKPLAMSADDGSTLIGGFKVVANATIPKNGFMLVSREFDGLSIEGEHGPIKVTTKAGRIELAKLHAAGCECAPCEERARRDAENVRLLRKVVHNERGMVEARAKQAAEMTADPKRLAGLTLSSALTPQQAVAQAARLAMQGGSMQNAAHEFETLRMLAEEGPDGEPPAISQEELCEVLDMPCITPIERVDRGELAERYTPRDVDSETAFLARCLFKTDPEVVAFVTRVAERPERRHKGDDRPYDAYSHALHTAWERNELGARERWLERARAVRKIMK